MSEPPDLLEVYTQANLNFRALTDIRFKLLALLPLGTGIAVVAGKDTQHPGVFLFGAVVTFALWVYDQRNNQHYDELVGQAAHIEREMGLHGGPFDSRPRSWWQLSLDADHTSRGAGSKHALSVEHRWPITTIYAAALTAWIGQFLSSAVSLFHLTVFASIGVWCFAAGTVWLVAFCVQESYKQQKKILRRKVLDAHHELAQWTPREAERLVTPPLENPDDERNRTRLLRAIAACTESRSLGLVEARLRHFLSIECNRAPFRPVFNEQRNREVFVPDPATDVVAGKLGQDAAAHILGQIIDMPPRWIRDISGRRAEELPDQKDDKAQGDRNNRSLPCPPLALIGAAVVSFAIALAQGPQTTDPAGRLSIPLPPPGGSAEAVQLLYVPPGAPSAQPPPPMPFSSARALLTILSSMIVGALGTILAARSVRPPRLSGIAVGGALLAIAAAQAVSVDLNQGDSKRNERRDAGSSGNSRAGAGGETPRAD